MIGRLRASFGLILLVAAAVLTALVVVVAGERHSAPVRGTKGSGVLATERRSVPAFTRLDLAGAANVTVHVGGPRAVVVRGDDNLLPLVTTSVAAGRLTVSQSAEFTTRHDLRVEVTVPSLAGVLLSGAGDVAVTGVRADRFAVDLAGVGSVDVDGVAGHLDATLSGIGSAHLEHLRARDANAVLSGTGSATVNATRFLDASVSGTGSIVYLGAPRRLTTTVTGAGTVLAA